jgi:ubiquitin carboxyl-terminal hydrolase 16/45
MLNEMDEASEGKTVNPVELLGRIRQKAPQFKGWRQQDAHELVLSVVGRLDDEQIDERKARKAKSEAEAKARRPEADADGEKKDSVASTYEPSPIMATVFSGRICSTVVCQACSTVSRSWEPFVDLSLELPEVRFGPVTMHALC